jgi:hypothetical protein
VSTLVIKKNKVNKMFKLSKQRNREEEKGSRQKKKLTKKQHGLE